jgi:hypothetical protein
VRRPSGPNPRGQPPSPRSAKNCMCAAPRPCGRVCGRADRSWTAATFRGRARLDESQEADLFETITESAVGVLAASPRALLVALRHGKAQKRQKIGVLLFKRWQSVVCPQNMFFRVSLCFFGAFRSFWPADSTQNTLRLTSCGPNSRDRRRHSQLSQLPARRAGSVTGSTGLGPGMQQLRIHRLVASIQRRVAPMC